MIEFIIVVVLFLAVVLAIIEFGTVVYTRALLGNALNAAAREAAVSRTNCETVAAATFANELDGVGYQPAYSIAVSGQETTLPTSGTSVYRVRAQAQIPCGLCGILGFRGLSYKYDKTVSVSLETPGTC